VNAPLLNQRPDPEDGAHTVAVYWLLRSLEITGVFIFSNALPWKMPMMWFLLVAGFGTWRWWHVTRPGFRDLPIATRRKHYRICVWISMFFVGSAAYFLYAPGNLPMLAILAVYVLGSAALVAMRVAGDFTRTVVAVCLVILPTSIRLIAEGLQGNFLLSSLGIAGVLATVCIASMSRLQERALTQQFELRQRAERAADAIAKSGLDKARFFAAVSHDLRQPVHAIGLYLAPLLTMSKGHADTEVQKAIEGIRQSWRALDDLLSQVLDLTRMDSGAIQARLQSVDLEALMRSVILQHSAVAERSGIRIVVLVKPSSYVKADALMLQRVLSNLLDNAIKFSEAGQTVAMAARGGANHWRIQVRDAGLGIALGAQSRIFEEFVQLDNEARDRRRGLGLGLAISKRFTDLMDGELSVRSTPSRGCCMTIKLLRASAPLEIENSLRANAPMETAASHIPSSAEHASETLLASKNVLLVEDDLLVAHAMLQLLRAWGLNVLHVESAAEAMEQAAFGQIAICDVRLPHGESGVDVALQMRSLGKKTLLISGETDVELRKSAHVLGLPLLIKPVSPAKLFAALQSL
jgi:two-component system, sensor histidine kinase